MLNGGPKEMESPSWETWKAFPDEALSKCVQLQTLACVSRVGSEPFKCPFQPKQS